MKITTVGYSFLPNLGDYQNERFEMTAEVQEGETPEEVVKELKQQVLALCGERAVALEQRRWKLQEHCDRLEQKIKDYQAKWNAAAEFLRAQGIKPDAPNFPDIVGLLPAGEPEPEIVELDDIPL